MERRAFYIIILSYGLLFGAIANSNESSIASLEPTLELKIIDGSSIPIQNGIPLYTAEPQNRPKISLNGLWKKERVEINHFLSLTKRTPETITRLEQESNGRNLPDYNDTQWEEHYVPSPENPPPDRYQGGMWYRKKITVSEEHKGNFLKLTFQASNYVTDIWINGKWIGYHEGGYTPFSFNITPYINFATVNTIAVRIDNIPWLPNQAAEKPLYSGMEIVPYKTCDWWNYGGILRDVYIEICPAINISSAQIITTLKSKNAALIDVTAILFNYSGRKTTITTKINLWGTALTSDNILNPQPQAIIDYEKTIGFKGTGTKSISFNNDQPIKPVKFQIQLINPALWSPQKPDLYVLEISLCEIDTNANEVKKDIYYTQFGIRKLHVNPGACRLFLNDKLLYLTGVARHEVFFNKEGKHLTLKDVYKDLEFIKEMNVNFLRTGHYPNEPELYILTDRMGFLVWEEIPVYWFDKDGFDIQYKRGIATQMWLEMIYRDYNRPSIMFWGTCNECATQNERREFIKELSNLAHSIDSDRLVVQSASGSDPLDKTHEVCDLIGVTMYYGVFYGKDYYEDTLKALEIVHASYPDKPIIVTEYGTWSGLDQSFAEKQVTLAKETLKAVYEKPYVVGWIWWTAFDWYSMITTFQTMGTITLCRDYIKPIYYYLQKEYGKKISPLEIDILSPPHYATVRGLVEIKNKIKSSYKIEDIIFTINNQPITLEKGFIYKWDTTQFPDGEYILTLKVKDTACKTLILTKKVFVDNIDNPPEITVNVKDEDYLMKEKNIEIALRDDRSPPMDLSASIFIDESQPRPLPSISPGKFSYLWNLKDCPDLTEHKITITADDGKGGQSEKTINVIVDNSPGIYVKLPYNHDWTSWQKNMSDGTGWDYPAEELPQSNTDFIYNGRAHVKFIFGNKEDGKMNNIECQAQKIDVAPAKCKELFILGASHDGSTSTTFTLEYEDGKETPVTLNFSDWWGAVPMFSEELAIKCSHHHERNNRDNPPGIGIYLLKIELNPEKKLKAIILPEEPRLHIFAITIK